MYILLVLYNMYCTILHKGNNPVVHYESQKSSLKKDQIINKNFPEKTEQLKTRALRMNQKLKHRKK